MSGLTWEEKRWFVIALLGGEAGAALGLLFFGGILFVPMLCALGGSALAPLGVFARQRYAARQLAAG